MVEQYNKYKSKRKGLIYFTNGKIYEKMISNSEIQINLFYVMEELTVFNQTKC